MREYKAEDLWDVIHSTHDMACNNCGSTDNIHGADDGDAIEYFFKAGWRKTRGNCYCPKCASQKLKLKKQAIP